ncbi:MAG TPA: metallophosphoesterase [bacterium]|nr:metallophosphoesterase [bacterium]
MIGQPLFWLYLLFQFCVFVFLVNRFGIRPHRQVAEFLWVILFLAVQGGGTLGLASAWDFSPDSAAALPLFPKAWLALTFAWAAFMAWDMAWWLLARRKPVAARLTRQDFANRPSRWRAPYPFLDGTVFQNQLYDLEVDEYEVRLPGWPKAWDGLSLVQVSDLHVGKFVHRPYLEWVVAKARALKPDLFALTGDFISFPKHLPFIGKLFQNLRAPLGTYAVLGNHDHWSDAPGLIRTLQEDGVKVLVNEGRMLRRRGKTLAILGVDDKWTGNQDLGPLFQVKADAKILLAHQPDHFKLAQKLGANLQISGHCHGGQICFPLLGPLVVPSDEGRKYAAGFIREKDSVMFINRGIGGYPPLRTLCPPQVVKLVLKSGV